MFGKNLKISICSCVVIDDGQEMNIEQMVAHTMEQKGQLLLSKKLKNLHSS